MIEIKGVDFEVSIAPKRAIDRSSIELDISLAKIVLNWEPKVSLIEDIRNVWNNISRSFLVIVQVVP